MSESIRILCVEDDSQVATRIESIIYALGYQVLKTVDNSTEALKKIKEEKPDILIMDIDIKGELNGIEVVNRIVDNNIPVIFVTGHDEEEYYLKAKKTAPVAYLVKPFNKFTFENAIENAILRLGKSPGMDKSENADDEDLKNGVWLKDSFFIKRNNMLQKVKVDDIHYIQSDGNYCDIISEKKFAVKMSLVKLMKKLPAKKFVRIHQRYVIQASLIENIDTSDNLVYLAGKSFPLGPKFKEDLMKTVQKL